MDATRKLWLVLALAALAVIIAVPAYATVGDSGYETWNSMGGANGTSPHGGYSTTTQKCVVCHAVHSANQYGAVLLNSSVADACNYCHVGGAGGYTQVYNGDTDNYSVADLSNAHNYWVGGPGVTCTQCHQVHAASYSMTNNAYLTTKLLIGRKSSAGNYDTFAGAPLASDTSETALTKWCTSCHPVGLGTADATYYNGEEWDGTGNVINPPGQTLQAHVMTTDTAAYLMPDNSTRRIAWAPSSYCSSCHASGYQTSAWPHFTAGDRFLTSAASDASVTPTGAVDGSEDGVCLRCHRDGVTSGVGVDF